MDPKPDKWSANTNQDFEFNVVGFFFFRTDRKFCCVWDTGQVRARGWVYEGMKSTG